MPGGGKEEKASGMRSSSVLFSGFFSTMAQQMGISAPQLKKLQAGELSRTDYLAILHERGIVYART
jgi:hypothetical protein